MIIGNRDTRDEVFLVAEIGNNHEGSEELAGRMIEAAAASGAHAVKFQTFRTLRYQSPSADPARYHRLRTFELRPESFLRLAKLAELNNVLFFSSPFDIESAQFLATFVPCLKIASADNDFWPLLDVVARTGLPVILSTGLADVEQVRASAEYIRSGWKSRQIKQDLALLHCVTSYPVPHCEANLLAIPYLRNIFRCTVGYSDHTIGLDACASALALGARIIEKHFTLNKNQSDFRDHQLSATPEEFQELARMARVIPGMLGEEKKQIQICERPFLPLVRRSIAVNRPLLRGAVIRAEDLTWVRPGGGFPPGAESSVVGRTLCRDLAEGEILVEEALLP